MSNETLTTTTNWRLLPKHARVGDYKNLISPKYANQYNEYAFRVLMGDPYKYSTVLEFILDVLEKKDGWVKSLDLRIEARTVLYHDVVIASALKRLESIANIGRKWEAGVTYFRWYEKREGDELNQTAIDNF